MEQRTDTNKHILSHCELIEALTYDPNTGIFTWVRPSKYHSDLVGEKAGHPYMCGKNKEYTAIQINGRKYKASRLAYLYMTGKHPKHLIDHINGNSLDDRWENLREVTHTQNMWNLSLRSKSSGLPMGVRKTRCGKYEARIRKNGELETIGVFDSPDNAHNSYIAKRREYFGKYNRL